MNFPILTKLNNQLRRFFSAEKFSGTFTEKDGLPRGVTVTYENSPVKPKISIGSEYADISFGVYGRTSIFRSNPHKGAITWSINGLKIKIDM